MFLISCIKSKIIHLRTFIRKSKFNKLFVTYYNYLRQPNKSSNCSRHHSNNINITENYVCLIITTSQFVRSYTNLCKNEK